MVKIDVDKFLKPDESYYSFVIGVAKHAREITEEQLHKMKELSEQEKSKNTVIDRAKQLPEELSTKPVRLAIEDIKMGKCHLDIESAEKVLEQEEQERIQKLLEHQRALEGKADSLGSDGELQEDMSQIPNEETQENLTENLGQNTPEISNLPDFPAVTEKTVKTPVL
jgi:DNA-directed RNA polymerase subunit K/omega